MKIQKPPRTPAAARARIPAPVTSEAAGRGLWPGTACSRCPKHPVVPHKPPCPAVPDSPFRNLQTFSADQYLYWLFIVSESCVFGDPTWQSEQPKAAAVTGGEKKRKKKSTEGERDPDLAGFATASNGDGRRGRKEERKREWHEKEWRDEGAEERKQEQEKQSHRWRTGAGACRQPGEIPSLALAVLHTDAVDLLLRERKVTHGFGICYVRALGGFLGWLTEREESSSSEVKRDPFLLPSWEYASPGLAGAARCSLMICKRRIIKSASITCKVSKHKAFQNKLFS